MASAAERLPHAITEYARFNARRTLSTAAESAFEVAGIGQVHALRDPARPQSPMCNRILALSGIDPAQLDTLLAPYRALGCTPSLEIVADPLSADLAQALKDRGFQEEYTLDYMALEPRAMPSSAVTVERWGPEQADAFRDLLALSGVHCEDEIWERRRGDYCTRQFRTFVTRIDNTPCAWATSFWDPENRTAIFANAFTLPDFRERGCHHSLLAARIQDALELGVEYTFTDVLPQSASASHCSQVGFERLVSSQLWILKADQLR